MVKNFETKYLAFDINTELIDYYLQCKISYAIRRPVRSQPDLFGIGWAFYFYNSKNLEVYCEVSETRFVYEPGKEKELLTSVETDFNDFKRFIAKCLLDLQKNLFYKDERLLFPEIDIEKLSCILFQKLIMISE